MTRSLAKILLPGALLLVLISCSKVDSTLKPSTASSSGTGTATFDDYLTTEITPADGFDFPFGNGDGTGSYRDLSTGKRYEGWYIATNFGDSYNLGIHPGEDWNGNGGSNTDLGQEVFAVANGRVVFAGSRGRLWGNVIVIEHLFYENQEKKMIRSVYAHLNELKVVAGKSVRRRQVIGTVGQDPDKLFNAHLHLELRWNFDLAPDYWPTSDRKDLAWVKRHYANPSIFIKGRRDLFVPQNESVLVLVDQASYRLRIFERGKRTAEYNVSFGQGKGPKELEGDNKTPAGMYFVVQKHRGEFDGPYASYYGGHWIKINYPNKFDAARGRATNQISSAQQESIEKAWLNRKLTPQNTKLGGGIGFHGWNREWKNDGPRHLSWGCIVLHLSDVGEFYDDIPEGTMVVIL